jgi:GAF domain-containing protein
MYAIARSADPAKNLRRLERAVEDALRNAPTVLAGLCNAAAFIMAYLADVNWAGFYILEADGDRLTLGPFLGLPACTEIAMGAGVCGGAAARRQALRVDDVAAFPGHIACDAASRSELVTPIMAGGRLWGVLDLDSPLPGRFSAAEEACCAQLCAMLGDFLTARGRDSAKL